MVCVIMCGFVGFVDKSKNKDKTIKSLNLYLIIIKN